ncbi:MAG: hypothetical protein KGI97_05945, partial [Alphaproteobacteria bacterium]|nr:hypothetical protein [Alphaproteobacteria bacterium]
MWNIASGVFDVVVIMGTGVFVGTRIRGAVLTRLLGKYRAALDAQSRNFKVLEKAFDDLAQAHEYMLDFFSGGNQSRKVRLDKAVKAIPPLRGKVKSLEMQLAAARAEIKELKSPSQAAGKIPA